MTNINTISCPNCHKKHDWHGSKPWSPFCSKRCKLIDLGDWASEKHAIAGDPATQLQIDLSDT
jgi:uncharacterized protein